MKLQQKLDNMPKLRERDLYYYSSGEAGPSIVSNGITNFGFLFFLQILGMPPSQVGVALFVATLWDAVSDPLMGYISDNTRTRIGRRHPYMIIGGLGVAVSFYFLWNIPDFVDGTLIFWYILIVNLLIRTMLTVFSVPFTALGFEICPEYTGRSKLQGIRFCSNMIVNFIAGAVAWPIFFKDAINEDGSRLDGSYIAQNFETMGTVLSFAALVTTLLCVALTWRYAKPFHLSYVNSVSPRQFIADFWYVINNRVVLLVFATFSIALLGMMLASKFQMITYVNYMGFTAGEKTIVLGSGMIAFAGFAFFLGNFVRKFDKKPTGYIGITIAIFGGVVLQVGFVGDLFPRDWVIPFTQWIPLNGGSGLNFDVLAFSIFQGLWWGGAGLMIPLATSMIADISGADYRKTGIVRDGTFSAIFSFSMKLSLSVGALITGLCLDLVGFDSSSAEQDVETLEWIATFTFLSGPLFMLIAGILLKSYPIHRTNYSLV